jgi:hypothetical protein
MEREFPYRLKVHQPYELLCRTIHLKVAFQCLMLLPMTWQQAEAVMM